jgi:hypothetical protein
LGTEGTEGTVTGAGAGLDGTVIPCVTPPTTPPRAAGLTTLATGVTAGLTTVFTGAELTGEELTGEETPTGAATGLDKPGKAAAPLAPAIPPMAKASVVAATYVPRLRAREDVRAGDVELTKTSGVLGDGRRNTQGWGGYAYVRQITGSGGGCYPQQRPVTHLDSGQFGLVQRGSAARTLGGTVELVVVSEALARGGGPERRRSR